MSPEPSQNAATTPRAGLPHPSTTHPLDRPALAAWCRQRSLFSDADAERIEPIAGATPRVFRARADEGTYFLRQATTAKRASMMAVEARTLEAFAASGLAEGLRAPARIEHDPEVSLLATSMASPSADLLAFTRNGGDASFDPELAADAGALLARLHATRDAAFLQRAELPIKRPMVWTYPQLFADPSMGARERELLARIDASPIWSRVPSLTRQFTACDDVLHGDVQWVNLRVARQSDEALGVSLVHWDCASRGDGVWDVAAFLSECLRCELTGATPGATWREGARALVDAYVRARGWSEAQEAAAVARIGEHMPFLLTLIAYRLAAGSPEALPPHAIAALDAADAWAADPASALSRAFGL